MNFQKIARVITTASLLRYFEKLNSRIDIMVFALVLKIEN